MSTSRLQCQLNNISTVSNAVSYLNLTEFVYFFGGLSCKKLQKYRLHDDSDFIVLGEKNYLKLTSYLCRNCSFREVTIPFFKGFSVKFYENTLQKNSGTVEIRYLEPCSGGWKFKIPFFAYPFTKFKSLGIPNIVFKNTSTIKINGVELKTLPIEYSYILKSYGRTNKDISDVEILKSIINKQLVRNIKEQAKKCGMSLVMNRVLFNYCRSRCTYGFDKKQYLELNAPVKV